jgi:hypothetical protein
MCFNIVAALLAIFVLKPMRIRHFSLSLVAPNVDPRMTANLNGGRTTDKVSTA